MTFALVIGMAFLGAASVLRALIVFNCLAALQAHSLEVECTIAVPGAAEKRIVYMIVVLRMLVASEYAFNVLLVCVVCTTVKYRIAEVCNQIGNIPSWINRRPHHNLSSLQSAQTAGRAKMAAMSFIDCHLCLGRLSRWICENRMLVLALLRHAEAKKISLRIITS